MTTALDGRFANMPCHSHHDVAHAGDKTVSPDSFRESSSKVFSEGLEMSDDVLLTVHNPTEDQFAVELSESQYMYHLAFDDSLPLDLNISHSDAENRAVEVVGKSYQSEVTNNDTKPSTTEVVVSENERFTVEIGADEVFVHGGSDSQTETSSVSALPVDTEAVPVVCPMPRTSTPVAVEGNGHQSAVSGNSVSELFDTDHIVVNPTAVRMPSEPDTAVIVSSSIIDTDNVEHEQSCMNVEDESLDHDWDGSPSDVGDEDNVHVCGASGVSRIIPVTTVSHANNTSEMNVVTSASKQADVTDRDPSGGEEYCQSTTVSTSAEDLLVLVNFRITSDRYEGSSMASETRESFSRMIVRQSDVLPKMTLSDGADNCSTENRQFYMVQKQKTNIVLGDESVTMAAADDGRLSDFSQTDRYSIRNVSDTTTDRIRQLAERSVTRTTRVVKHVVVTKTETTMSEDDDAERKVQDVDSETTDGEDDHKHETTWITEVVRGSSIETEDTGDSCAGENETTTGYMSASDNYEHEDAGDSFSSGLEEMETITDIVKVDTTLVVSDDDNIESTGIAEGTVDRITLEAGDREVEEIAENKICDEFPDDDERKSSSAVEIRESDEAKDDHVVDVHSSVELQETHMYEVTETEPVDILITVPASTECEFNDTAVKMSMVENYVQVTEADDGEGNSEDAKLSDISEIDTSVLRPDIYTVDEVTVPGTIVITNKGGDEDMLIRENEAGDVLDEGSDITESIESSEDLMLPEIEEAEDIVLEKVSDIEETDVENRTLIDHKSELYDTVLKFEGVETFVQPVTYSGVICCETSVVSTVSDIETRAVSPSVETHSDTAAEIEERIEAHTDAIIYDSADRYADDTVTELDMTEKSLVYPDSVSDEACGNVVTKQTKTLAELQLVDATEDDQVAETGDVEMCRVCSFTIFDEAEDVLDTAVIVERIETHVGIVEDYTMAKDGVVIKADIAETVSPEIVSYMIDSAVKSDRVEFHLEAMSADEAEYAEQIEAPAVSAGTFCVDNDSDVIAYAVVMQNKLETQVQTVVTGDSAGSMAEQPITQFDDVETCTVILDVVTDEAENVIDTAITTDRIDTSVSVVTDKEGNEQDLHIESSITEVCPVSADTEVTDVFDSFMKLENSETCVGVQIHDECDDSNAVAEFSEPVTCRISQYIVTEEDVGNISAAGVKSRRTETYVDGIEEENDDDEAIETTALNEVEASAVPHQTVRDESIFSAAVKSENVNTQTEKVITGDVYDTVADLEDVETCSLGITAADDEYCLDISTTVKSNSIETYVGETVTDSAAKWDSVVTINRDKSEVFFTGVYSVSEASNAVFVNTVRFQTNRELVVSTTKDPGLLGARTAEAGMNGMNRVMLREVETDDMRDDGQDNMTPEKQSAACQTDGGVVHLLKEASTISVGLQTAFSDVGANAGAAELVDKDDDGTVRVSCDRDVKTTQTEEDTNDMMISVHEGVERMDLLSTAIQTDQINPVSLCTVETQTGRCEMSNELFGNGNELITADACTLTAVDVAVVETQTLPYKDEISTAEAQTSTALVDIVSTDTQTIEHKRDLLMVEAETCTTSEELSLADTQTSLDVVETLTVEAQTNTTPVDVAVSDTQTVDTLMVEAETCTTPVDVALVDIQTSLDEVRTLTTEAETNTTSVDVAVSDTQTVDTLMVEAETCTTPVDVALVDIQTSLDEVRTLTLSLIHI